MCRCAGVLPSHFCYNQNSIFANCKLEWDSTLVTEGKFMHFPGRKRHLNSFCNSWHQDPLAFPGAHKVDKTVVFVFPPPEMFGRLRGQMGALNFHPLILPPNRNGFLHWGQNSALMPFHTSLNLNTQTKSCWTLQYHPVWTASPACPLQVVNEDTKCNLLVLIDEIKKQLFSISPIL